MPECCFAVREFLLKANRGAHVPGVHQNPTDVRVVKVIGGNRLDPHPVAVLMLEAVRFPDRFAPPGGEFPRVLATFAWSSG
ncbi:hypothetical protein ACFSC4_29190 [Deinococcus malanensis]|uniref:hypothetical protein n=1 Tax=Deinococcus malanensis TaxID=1706855 RepID=UPI00363FD99B